MIAWIEKKALRHQFGKKKLEVFEGMVYMWTLEELYEIVWIAIDLFLAQSSQEYPANPKINFFCEGSWNTQIPANQAGNMLQSRSIQLIKYCTKQKQN